MKEFNFANDIELLKHESNIRKFPDSPLAHLRLGHLYLRYGFYKKAKNSFLKSYSCDNRFFISIIGIALCDIYMRRYLRAIHLIDKYKENIKNNHLLKYKLIRTLSNNFPDMSGKLKRIDSIFFGKLNKTSMDNPLFLLLICSIRSLEKYKTKATIEDLSIFNTCVFEKGLTSGFRYRLISIIYLSDPNIIKDKRLALLFHSISDRMDIDYTNFIFKSILDSFNFHHVKRIYKSIDKTGKPISNENLWKYISLCKDHKYFNISTTNSCLTLLKKGWIDDTVINSLRKTNEKLLNKFKLFV